MGKTQSKDYLADLLRVAATLLVVFGHCSFYRITTNSALGIDWSAAIVDQTRFITLMNRLTALVYSCHMELFMFISGMVFGFCMLHDKYPSFKGMVEAKAKRLLIPYVAITFFYNTPILIASGYIRGGSLGVLLENVCLYFVGFGKNHLWYLPTLFVITIMSYGLYRAVMRTRWGDMIGWAVILCLLCVRCLFSFQLWEGLYMDRIVKYFVWFELGRALYSYRDAINKRISRAKVLLSVGFGALWFSMFYMHQRTGLMIFELLAVLTGIAFWYTTALCVYKALLDQPLIRFVSAKSMVIYLYGVPINYIVMTVLMKNRPALVMTEAGSAALFFARFVLQIIGAILIDFIVQVCKKRIFGRSIP